MVFLLIRLILFINVVISFMTIIMKTMIRIISILSTTIISAGILISITTTTTATRTDGDNSTIRQNDDNSKKNSSNKNSRNNKYSQIFKS